MRADFVEPRPGQVVHEMTFRVAMRDMDHANIYYAAYYEWMDRSFAEFVQKSGHSLREIFDGGFGAPIVESSCSYFAPVSLDDVLRVRSWISRMGRSSFTVTHDFTRVSDGARVARGSVTHVWVRRAQMESVPTPDWFRQLGPPAAPG